MMKCLQLSLSWAGPLIMAVSVALVPICSAEPASATYDRLRSIQDDRAALNEIQAPSWVSSPNMRGTSDILQSCILTLFACVYTALHLNIPDRNASDLRLLWDKFRWVVITLIAPEIVLYYAGSQFWDARSLAMYLQEKELAKLGFITRERPGWFKRFLCALCRQQIQKPTDKYVESDDECIFDLEYGFFVTMGGLEILHAPGGEQPKHRVLSPGGVRRIADHGIEMLRIPRTRMLDQSKSNTLQKVLVLFQVSWMALQCIIRKIYGLPLSLLELHTMVHVMCALVMYIFWLRKPLDIRGAETINIEEFAHHLAPVGSIPKEQYFYDHRGNLYGFKPYWLTSVVGFLDWMDKIGDFDANKPLLTFLVLPTVYGGVHLSGWNFNFPTWYEAAIWKAACISIAAALPALGACFLCVALMDGWSMRMGSMMGLLYMVLLFVVVPVMLVFLAAFRGYIVLESFISLRAVPIGVYWTPDWIQTIPHL